MKYCTEISFVLFNSQLSERSSRQLHARDQLHNARRPHVGHVRRTQRPPSPDRASDRSADGNLAQDGHVWVRGGYLLKGRLLEKSLFLQQLS